MDARSSSHFDANGKTRLGWRLEQARDETTSAMWPMHVKWFPQRLFIEKYFLFLKKFLLTL